MEQSYIEYATIQGRCHPQLLRWSNLLKNLHLSAKSKTNKTWQLMYTITKYQENDLQLLNNSQLMLSCVRISYDLTLWVSNTDYVAAECKGM